jgi:hypothetical protein
MARHVLAFDCFLEVHAKMRHASGIVTTQRVLRPRFQRRGVLGRGISSIIDPTIAHMDGKPVHPDFGKRVKTFPCHGD